ncbi:class I glutamine amidotransferase-like protein [Acephala macrosclerotiorum]|nr:class I glutamine amidotransferase-like protein [Acephala macrosclerotiorum]
MTSSSGAAPISILFLAYPHFNTLDIHGPLDVLGNPYIRQNLPSDSQFNLTIAASHEVVKSYEGALLARHISFPHALQCLSSFDILIQPGGLTADITPHLGTPAFAEQLAIITAFAKLGSSPRLNGDLRIVMSICTGAIFCGYAGIFAGLDATTHFLALDNLKDVCNGYNVRAPGSAVTNVVPNPKNPDFRYVKVQTNPNGTARVISSGGISCGIDASLYLVSLLRGKNVAVNVADMMQYSWREM